MSQYEPEIAWYDSSRSYPQRAYWLRFKYGITEEEYVRLYNLQMGRCAICLAPNNGRKLMSVDHDHVSGAIRGLLCHGCNAGLGLFEDSIANLLSAALYLERTESMKESESHKRYMEKYNGEKHRERLDASGVLAPEAGQSTFNWAAYYTQLYTKLGLEDLLPQVLQSLE